MKKARGKEKDCRISINQGRQELLKKVQKLMEKSSLRRLAPVVIQCWILDKIPMIQNSFNYKARYLWRYELEGSLSSQD